MTKPIAAVVVSEIARQDAAVVATWSAYRLSREEMGKRRLALGEALIAVRGRWPRSGPRARPWGEYLAARDIDQDAALDAMAYAGYLEENPPHAPGKLPTMRDAGLDRRPRVGDRDVKPDDRPQLSLVPDPVPRLTMEQLRAAVAVLAPEDRAAIHKASKPARDASAGDRDSYCTPEAIACCFPVVDFDPCSNSRATIRSRRACWFVERGEDGLAIDWAGSGYWNVPYSKPLPWAQKFDRDRSAITAAGWLVNTDQSTEWWSLLVRSLPLRLDFDERIQFVAAPGVVASQNDRPQTLLMDEPFWRGCDQPALLKLGTLWRRSGLTLT